MLPAGTSVSARFMSDTGVLSTASLRHPTNVLSFLQVEEAVLEYERDLCKEACTVSLKMIQNQVHTIVRKQRIIAKYFHVGFG